jgi:hypothetical protein
MRWDIAKGFDQTRTKLEENKALLRAVRDLPVKFGARQSIPLA